MLEAHNESHIALCFDALHELRPHLVQAGFTDQVLEQMSQGYRLFYALDGARAGSVAGFRVQQMLHSGKTLYIDDFVTLTVARRRGLGRLVFSAVEAEARRLNCRTLSLDSGPRRTDAHRFYLNHGLQISSLHFARILAG